MSWQLSSGCLARAYALAIFVHVSGGYVARAYVLATIETRPGPSELLAFVLGLALGLAFVLAAAPFLTASAS